MSFSPAQQRLLLAVAGDYFLKAQRDIEGHKTYQLHPLRGNPILVSGDDVQALCDQGLLDSNKKFPAATFWLTDAGRTVAAQLTAAEN